VPSNNGIRPKMEQGLVVHYQSRFIGLHSG